MRLKIDRGNKSEPVVTVTGRNEEGKIEYIVRKEGDTRDLILEVIVNKEDVTRNFFSNAENEESLAHYRGGKATRLACDLLKEIIYMQSHQEWLALSRDFLIYTLKQVEFVCKENIEDVLGVRGIDTGVRDYKETQNKKSEEDNEGDSWL